MGVEVLLCSIFVIFDQFIDCTTFGYLCFIAVVVIIIIIIIIIIFNFLYCTKS